jgi:branched-chain amino acid aminotransferase
MRACVASWRRIDDNAVPARAKITGAYINSALAKTEAFHKGFDEAILLNPDGHVSEGSAMNLFIVRNGRLITPAVNHNILEGVTRRAVMQIAFEEMGIPTDERTIDRTELYVCDEMFVCGMSLGHADPQAVANRLVTEREPVSGFARFLS